jgi:uncharacterized membrane protein
MLIATVSSFGYRLFLLLHVLAVICAFAPGFVVPFLNRRFKAEGEEVPSTLWSAITSNSLQIQAPALVLAGVFGIGMVGLSDKAWQFKDSWVSIALALWLVTLAVLFAGIIPAERQAAGGSKAAEARTAAFVGVMHLLLVALVIIMIWKPGA